MNSFSGVEKALTVEIARQRSIVAAGGKVEHETLLWDERTGQVRPMRSKEESHDYRYFPDPDLPPLMVARERIEAIRADLPELPAVRRARLQEEYGLPAYDAAVLTASRPLADYYEAAARAVGDPKEASNWIMGPVLAAMKVRGEEADAFPVRPEALAELIAMVGDGTINRRATGKVLDEMLAEADARRAQLGTDAPEGTAATAPPLRSPAEIVEAKGWAQVSGGAELERWIDEALAAHPEELGRLRGGEKRLQGFFIGEVMKRSRGKADPKQVARLLGERAAGR
jgi:aspartyl-tRNA(Asn)/glutamyl-tRNA(Gln) amidotransferase subunit B